MFFKFSSPCLGILFSPSTENLLFANFSQFSSPCLGILFSPSNVPFRLVRLDVSGFRPHVWGFFFHVKKSTSRRSSTAEFSSPCLGILFSQQAWGAPRDGLSIALLRRGFPIDWNSHYFHPLTFCFLRFHAYRRGFLYL